MIRGNATARSWRNWRAIIAVVALGASVAGATINIGAHASTGSALAFSGRSRVMIQTVLRAGRLTRLQPATKQVSSPSVMIQVSSLASAYTPTSLRAALSKICPQNVQPTGQLVLQDVASTNGTLVTNMLDVIAPFLPGVSLHPCFSRVYVGTVEPDWTGSGSAYVDGVQDPTFVSNYLATSAQAARAFVQRYPNVATDWYLTYEANLNELFYPQVAAAYGTMLAAQINTLTALKPAAQVMWSPAFWYPYSSYSQNTAGMAGLQTSLSTLFTQLRATSKGITTIALQDYVSGSSCQPTWNRVTRSDAVGWLRFLRTVGTSAPTVSMNTEQYGVDCSTGGIINGNATEVRNREAYYQGQGVALGPAFELRYWMANHP